MNRQNRQAELEAMSVFEINTLVANIIYKNDKSGWSVDERCPEPHENSIYIRFNDSVHYISKDYCNNPEDIMPIAIENKISCEWDSEGKIWWSYSPRAAYYLDPKITSTNQNSYRARCIVFILMMENKNG